MVFSRYDKTRILSSNLNKLDDVVGWLGYLTSSEYLCELLTKVHGLSRSEAKDRAKKIIPHASAAISLIHQSLNGPEDVSFLPAYYSILDLAKIYILLGPRHRDLLTHRWHGATYDVAGKDSHSLLTEVITLRKGGSLALFYETLTGRPVTKERTVHMRDVYPYIADISAEYAIATGGEGAIVQLVFSMEGLDANHMQIMVRVIPKNSATVVGLSDLPILTSFKKHRVQPNCFVSSPIELPVPITLDELSRHVDRRLLFYSANPESQIETALSKKSFPMPEEFPIALLFFHMSSVVRYKPELVEKFRQGKYWPLLSTARRHCLVKFILLTWSYLHKEQFLIRSI